MITLDKISKSYGPKPICNSISYIFPEGERIALVGPNGTGKTTLLNIICGFEEPDGGAFRIPKKVRLGYLPQDPNPNPKSTLVEEAMDGASVLRQLTENRENALHIMTQDYNEENYAIYEKAEEAWSAAGGHTIESKAKTILLGLGFKDSDFTKDPKSLSGGWRMRLEFVRMFLNEPNFLVLDEPTNHLDLPSLVYIEQFLRRYTGTILFVSHDITLLNSLATVTLHLYHGKLTPYKGNFDDFLEQREEHMAQQASSARVLQKRKEQMEVFISRFRATASKARLVQSQIKKLSRLKDLEGNDDEGDMEALQLNFPITKPSGKIVLQIENLTIGYENTPLLKNVSFEVEKGHKIAVIGMNGLGKSTLLKTITGHQPPLKGELVWGYNASTAFFAQDQLDILDPAVSIINNLMHIQSTVGEQKIRHILGSFLFKKDEVHKPVGVLSGGEKSRVGLACLCVKGANFLVLDEPTNHLDMSSASILANALKDFAGAALFVSHDRQFINTVCTHVLALTPSGKIGLFEGNLSDYERLSSLCGLT